MLLAYSLNRSALAALQQAQIRFSDQDTAQNIRAAVDAIKHNNSHFSWIAGTAEKCFCLLAKSGQCKTALLVAETKRQVITTDIITVLPQHGHNKSRF